MNLKSIAKNPLAYGVLTLIAFVLKERLFHLIGEVPINVIAWILLGLTGIFSLVFLFTKIYPFILLLTEAKFRGLMPKNLIDDFIYKYTFKSDSIKIKVTRAYNLFLISNSQSFKKVLDEINSNRKHREKVIKFQLLLHVPCQISEHVKYRARANNIANDIASFIKTWLETLNALDNYNKNDNNKVEFSVKFYSEKHTRWRFFIFKNPVAEKSKMLFDYYDSNSPSFREDMFSVASGKQSLLENFEKYFDHIWKNPNEVIEGFDFVNTHFAVTDNCLTKCSSCPQKTSCEEIKNEFKSLIMSESLKIIDTDTLYKTKLFEISKKRVEYSKKNEKGLYEIEVLSRPPGVRILIVENEKILLTREFRLEINDWDYRLPGGRVFDTIDSYLAVKDNKHKMDEEINAAVVRESEEEAGIRPTKYELLHIDKLGASLFWDLYFFEVTKFDIIEQTVPKLGNDVGEIIYPEWFTVDEILSMCLEDKINETRCSGYLLKYLLKKRKEKK